MSAPPSNSSRLTKLLLLLAALCVLAGFLAQAWYAGKAASAANDASGELAAWEEATGTAVRAAAGTYQQSTLDVVDLVSRRPDLLAAINGDSASDAAMFAAVWEPGELPVTVELWGPGHVLRAWHGPLGIATDTASLAGVAASRLQVGPISSYYTVVRPVHDALGRTWHLVAKRLFDVNYPITNQFIDNSVFETAFGPTLGFPVRVTPNGAPEAGGDPAHLVIPLQSLEGRVIGTAYVERPSAQELADRFAGAGGKTAAACFSAAAAVVLVLLFLRWRRRRRWSGVTLLAAIWLTRYLLIWLDVPGIFGESPLVDPSVFASPFGGGLARSVADLLLSAGCLLGSALLIVSILSRGRERAARLPVAVRAAGVVGIGFVSAAAIRAFTAILRSVVVDSTLPYNDPAFIMPPGPLGVMLFALALIALAVLTVLMALATLSASWCGGDERGRGWFLSFAVAAAAGVVYGLMLITPLVGDGARTAILALVTLGAMLVFRGRSRGPLRAVLIPVAAVPFLLLPLLDEQVHDLDASRVELAAEELNRPSDAWMTVFTRQALEQLADAEASALLASGTPEEVRKLAFTQWAKSILSREGNNCSVTYLGSDGSVLSEFRIGPAPHRVGVQAADIASTRRYVEIDRSAGGSGIRWHRAYSPLVSADSSVAGGVWLELGEERGLGVRSGAPEFLTNYPTDRSRNQYRKLVVSEYLNGKMSTSSEEAFPTDRPLPASVGSGSGAVWKDETIAGRTYESYYLPLRTGTANGWIALSMEKLDLQWHLYIYVRSLLFFGLFVFLPALALLLALNPGILARLSRFKAKLAFSFIAVSLLPIALLAVYNRSYVEGRVRDADVRRLREQTQIGLSLVQRQIGTVTPFALANLTDERCMALADEWGTDFNVYAGDLLQAGSRPEVVTAELLDTRLSADAYTAVVLQRHGFFSEEQSIGRLPYLVGYRPIISDDGRVVGAFSVPTLFRQREIDEMATRRNIFLFGTYAFALLIAVALSTVVVNRISKPILRLKQATSLVASGNLDLRVRSGRRDELGELEDAFDEMTANLQRSQDEVVRTQRELAWREMARQVAHEIKNPLTPMRLSVQHLRQAYADGVGDFGSLLNRITATVLEQIDALSRIASEFSSFARMPPRTMQPCSMHAILRDVVALFQQKQLDFVLALEAANDAVRADPDELRRVIINILRNAEQAMGGRGRVTITSASTAATITVRLEDTGPGIPEHVRARLFEPNFSTKSEGMGLGLAIVKRAIDNLGGSVAVESTVGKGTAMILTLPLMEP